MVEVKSHLNYFVGLLFARPPEVIKLFIEYVRYFYHELIKDWLVLLLNYILTIFHDHSVDTLVHLHHHLLVLPVWVQ